MGGQLVRQVVAVSFAASSKGIPFTSNERQILMVMAALAKDDDEIPRYWGGREYLAMSALGRDIDRSGETERRSIYESVRKALAGLAKRGAIERSGTAHPGRRQEYLLTLERLRLGIETQPEVGPYATSGWANNNATLLKPQSDVGPNNQETHKTNSENPDHLSGPPHLRAVDNSSEVPIAV